MKAAALHGAIVALAALLGADCAITAYTAVDRAPRAAFVTARVITPAASAVRACTPTLTWTAATLLVLLVLGRQLAFGLPSCLLASLVLRIGPMRLPLLVRRRLALAFHTGGLYGP